MEKNIIGNGLRPWKLRDKNWSLVFIRYCKIFWQEERKCLEMCWKKGRVKWKMIRQKKTVEKVIAYSLCYLKD